MGHAKDSVYHVASSESIPVVLYCFSPLPLLVNSYAGKEINHTFHANATVNIQCDHGYVPFSPIDITCISNSILSSHTWVPDPSNLCFPLEGT